MAFQFARPTLPSRAAPRRSTCSRTARPAPALVANRPLASLQGGGPPAPRRRCRSRKHTSPITPPPVETGGEGKPATRTDPSPGDAASAAHRHRRRKRGSSTTTRPTSDVAEDSTNATATVPVSDEASAPRTRARSRKRAAAASTAAQESSVAMAKVPAGAKPRGRGRGRKGTPPVSKSKNEDSGIAAMSEETDKDGPPCVQRGQRDAVSAGVRKGGAFRRRAGARRRAPTEEEKAAAEAELVEQVIAEGEKAGPGTPVVLKGGGQDAMVLAVPAAGEEVVIVSRRPEEELVLRETPFRDGRYGACFNCGAAVVIPGLAQFYCEHCGWIRRPIETETIAPGHHD